MHAARVLLQELAAHGVRDVVLSPGSRSAPLAHALAAAASDAPPPGAPHLALHVRVDERSAGFLALGLAKAAASTGAPRGVAVVTTSGTAVANLHPAVLEAHHSGLPLVVLTADRPHELRGTGANQTTDQVGIFGAATRYAVDVPAPSGRDGESRDLRQVVGRAMTDALGTRTGHPGPVHLNLAFRDPLVPDDTPWPTGTAAGRPAVSSRRAGPAVVHVDEAGLDLSRAGVDEAGLELTVVVAGDGAGPVARAVAEARGWPLLAEPSSGARGGTHAIGAYRPLLDSALGRAVRRVVVLGRPTLSRPVQLLLAREDVQVIVVAPGGGPWTDPSRRAAFVLPEVPEAWWGARSDGGTGTGTGETSTQRGWLTAWQQASSAATAAVGRVLDEAEARDGTRSAPRLTGPGVARVVARATGPDDVLVVGSSNPVRDLDLVADWSASPVVLANRGLAGIDGTVSTAVGVALGLPGRRVRALLGDLTFLHDAGGLLRGSLEREPDLQIVVANDDGGSIFATLEHGAAEHAGSFERVFGTPHGADLAALCAGYGVRHQLARDAEELAVALAVPGPGISVVEVKVDRAGRRALGAALADAARQAAVKAAATDFAAGSQET
ncbi:MAG TPA: 2-succinyl-5-enolpyruvyl-6-hydroxy-3-cyclohexene-1-carboxylic-acid synthase [Cellulomonadaceae bacterium]|nr:2-succinyl-5-enolpyruvyl-6-hydroxy-3-cyclohexene-1-carboxylic-acid synthase [Cellulomonadaceae bacterium]